MSIKQFTNMLAKHSTVCKEESLDVYDRIMNYFIKNPTAAHSVYIKIVEPKYFGLAGGWNHYIEVLSGYSFGDSFIQVRSVSLEGKAISITKEYAREVFKYATIVSKEEATAKVLLKQAIRGNNV